ncbi:MAG TPA: DUF4405 domain-containing protein [Chitinivibrionales bacterium]|nr:DUF4405 domain-containing protein [Chitinivibrionales bacterium]
MAFSKTTALKYVNPALAIFVLAQAVTAVLFTFFSDVIPFGTVRQLHLITGYILFALIILHTYLNWTWIKSTFFKKRSKA